MRSRLRCLSCFLGVLCIASIHDVGAIVPTVVVPNASATSEGNINNIYPFCLDCAIISIPSQRYQQLYRASQFASIGSGGLITQIIFRPDASSGAFSSILPDIQINLSTTSALDDHLNSLFAANVGIDNTIVVPRGSLALSSAFTGPPGGPMDFDIVINLATPFFYNPSLGNLLLDVRNFGGGATTAFDARDVLNDGVSRIYTLAGNVNSDMADRNDSFGLVTGFTIIPEPRGPVLLLAGGAILFIWLGRRSRMKAHRPPGT
jgi:hypothetical protein